MAFLQRSASSLHVSCMSNVSLHVSCMSHIARKPDCLCHCAGEADSKPEAQAEAAALGQDQGAPGGHHLAPGFRPQPQSQLC